MCSKRCFRCQHSDPRASGHLEIQSHIHKQPLGYHQLCKTGVKWRLSPIILLVSSQQQNRNALLIIPTFICVLTPMRCVSFVPGVLTDQLCIIIDFFLFLHLRNMQQKGHKCVLNNFLPYSSTPLPHPKTYYMVCVWKMALLFLDIFHVKFSLIYSCILNHHHYSFYQDYAYL